MKKENAKRSRREIRRFYKKGTRQKQAVSRLHDILLSVANCASQMRTAIVHYWLLNMRGGEKVVEALCRLLPDADVFTLFYDPDRVSETIRAHRVQASFLQPLRKHYRSLLPLMPLALESFDLREYDLVISSESGPAKGVITSSSARHVCYCHTPMRYLWDLYPAYRNEWTRRPLEAGPDDAAGKLSAGMGLRLRGARG